MIFSATPIRYETGVTFLPHPPFCNKRLVFPSVMCSSGLEMPCGPTQGGYHSPFYQVSTNEQESNLHPSARLLNAIKAHLLLMGFDRVPARLRLMRPKLHGFSFPAILSNLFPWSGHLTQCLNYSTIRFYISMI